MRGQPDIGGLINEAIVAHRLNPPDIGTDYRAELRIAGYGTFLGNWRNGQLAQENARADLATLQAKHQPTSKGDGFSAAQHLSIKESLGQIAKRELGHNMNMAYEG